MVDPADPDASSRSCAGFSTTSAWATSSSAVTWPGSTACPWRPSTSTSCRPGWSRTSSASPRLSTCCGPRWRVESIPEGMKIDGGLEARHFLGDSAAIGLVTRLGRVDVVLEPRGFEGRLHRAHRRVDEVETSSRDGPDGLSARAQSRPGRARGSELYGGPGSPPPCSRRQGTTKDRRPTRAQVVRKSRP